MKYFISLCFFLTSLPLRASTISPAFEGTLSFRVGDGFRCDYVNYGPPQDLSCYGVTNDRWYGSDYITWTFDSDDNARIIDDLLIIDDTLSGFDTVFKFSLTKMRGSGYGYGLGGAEAYWNLGAGHSSVNVVDDDYPVYGDTNWSVHDFAFSITYTALASPPTDPVPTPLPATLSFSLVGTGLLVAMRRIKAA